MALHGDNHSMIMAWYPRRNLRRFNRSVFTKVNLCNRVSAAIIKYNRQKYNQCLFPKSKKATCSNGKIFKWQNIRLAKHSNGKTMLPLLSRDFDQQLSCSLDGNTISTILWCKYPFHRNMISYGYFSSIQT